MSSGSLSVGVGPKSVDEVCGFASRSGALAGWLARGKSERESRKSVCGPLEMLGGLVCIEISGSDDGESGF